MANLSQYRTNLFAFSCLLLTSFPVRSTTKFVPFPSLPQSFIQREIIKRDILRKLNINSRPPMGNPFKQPKKIVRTVSDKKMTSPSPPAGEYFAEIQEVISLSEQPQNVTSKNIIQFRVVRDGQGRKLEVKSANLLVRVKYPRQHRINGKRRKKNKRRKLSLYLSTVKDNGKPNITIASIVKAKIRKTTWFKMKIPERIIQHVLDSNEEVIRLHIRCKGCKNGAKLVLVKSNRRRRRRRKNNIRISGTNVTSIRKKQRRRRDMSRTRPFLILHTKMEKYLRRSKRSISDCSVNGTSGCCLSNYVVNIADLGWDDWILSPASYTTGICEGSCSTSHDAYSLSTQSSASQSNPTCSPTKQEPLSMTYHHDDYTIIIANVPNMVTKSCGCTNL